MKKLSKTLLAIMLVGVLMPLHQHDDYCGYDLVIKKGCVYEIGLLQSNGSKG